MRYPPLTRSAHRHGRQHSRRPERHTGQAPPGHSRHRCLRPRGRCTPGIITFPIPILAADEEQLRTLRRQAETVGLTAVDFTDLSQECRTYEEYIERMGHTPETALRYIGLALCGERKQVDHLTGSLPLLR